MDAKTILARLVNAIYNYHKAHATPEVAEGYVDPTGTYEEFARAYNQAEKFLSDDGQIDMFPEFPPQQPPQIK